MKSGSNLSISPYSCVRLKLWHACVMFDRVKARTTPDRSFSKNVEANSLESVSTLPDLGFGKREMMHGPPGSGQGPKLPEFAEVGYLEVVEDGRPRGGNTLQ